MLAETGDDNQTVGFGSVVACVGRGDVDDELAEVDELPLGEKSSDGEVGVLSNLVLMTNMMVYEVSTVVVLVFGT